MLYGIKRDVIFDEKLLTKNIWEKLFYFELSLSLTLSNNYD